MSHHRSARPARVARTLGLCLAAALGTAALGVTAAAPAAAQSPAEGRVKARATAVRARPAAPIARDTRPARGAPAPSPAPDPSLAADEVVGIVLAALAQAADRPGPDGAEDARPFALAFAFSSPANRAAVGTLERFSEMVHDDAYRPLLGHRGATRGALRVTGDRAVQRVVVTGADGERVAYTFSLARQGAGAFRGCWMTDGVVREAPSRLAPPQSA